MNRRNSALSLAVLGLMTAMVFVSNYLSIPVASSRIHLANAPVWLSACCGRVEGAVAAESWQRLFDITIPAYVSEADHLLTNAMVLVCGLVANKTDLPSPVTLLIGKIPLCCIYLKLCFHALLRLFLSTPFSGAWKSLSPRLTLPLQC